MTFSSVWSRCLSSVCSDCHNLRIKHHWIFKGIAQRDKSSTSWFFSFKLHTVVKQQGELLACIATLLGTRNADNDSNIVTQVQKNMKAVACLEFEQTLAGAVDLR